MDIPLGENKTLLARTMTKPGTSLSRSVDHASAGTSVSSHPSSSVGSIRIENFDISEHESILRQVHAIHFSSRDSEAKRHDYVRWLQSNPTPGSIYLAATVDGKFASFLGFMARELVGFGRTFRVALAFGAITDPQFAGRGLYRQLATAGWEAARTQGFDFCLGYTLRKYVLAMEVRMGWANMGAGPVLVLPLDPVAMARSVLPGLKALARPLCLAEPILRRRAERLARRARTQDVTIRQITNFPSDLDSATEALQAEEQLSFSKDTRTLDWLYLSPFNPFVYDIVEARAGTKLVGFGVGRAMDLNGLNGYGIVEFVVRPGYEEALGELASALVEMALARRPQAIGALVSRGSPQLKALRRLGFIDSRQAFTLIYRPASDDIPIPLDRAEIWQHSWGNNDTV